MNTTQVLEVDEFIRNLYSYNNVKAWVDLKPMGKKSKNASGFSDALTYHERKALGYGTVRERLGKVWACIVAHCSDFGDCHRPLASLSVSISCRTRWAVTTIVA